MTEPTVANRTNRHPSPRPAPPRECACTPNRICLWHYDDLTEQQQQRERRDAHVSNPGHRRPRA